MTAKRGRIDFILINITTKQTTLFLAHTTLPYHSSTVSYFANPVKADRKIMSKTDSPSSQYSVPCGEALVETEVKKSRFIALAAFADNRESALEMLERVKLRYPDARHHCWAYVIESGRSAAASDDGEPSGTAGKPILNVLQHKKITEIMLIVVRYFGGIKLGAGGLVRAYSAAAQAAISALEVATPMIYSRFTVSVEFANEAQLRYLIERFDGRIDKIDYLADVQALVAIPADNAAAWQIEAARILTCCNVVDMPPQE